MRRPTISGSVSRSSKRASRLGRLRANALSGRRTICHPILSVTQSSGQCCWAHPRPRRTRSPRRDLHQQVLGILPPDGRCEVQTGPSLRQPRVARDVLNGSKHHRGVQWICQGCQPRGARSTGEKEGARVCGPIPPDRDAHCVGQPSQDRYLPKRAWERHRDHKAAPQAPTVTNWRTTSQ